MALWTGLGQAATVAQLLGADLGGLISMIVQAALTARQNRKECEQLARRVILIAQLLPHLEDPEAVRQLAGLGDTLRDAHELVVSCQGKSAAYQLIMAGRQAERFREVQGKIDFYLILFPVISHICITRRLDRIYNVLVQDDSTRIEPSPPSQLSQLQGVLAHGTQEFTKEEILAATKNFTLDTKIGTGSFGTVHFGRLHDGREVAVKRMMKNQQYQQSSPSDLQKDFCTELEILSRVRHKYIIHLLGRCVSNDTRLLTWQRKEPERMIIYEFMENGSLFTHLHSSLLSPVTLSWKMRIDVLLRVSRAIEHLHCHANLPIIHHDIKSANILLDANWVPRLSDFGASVYRDAANEGLGPESMVRGTFGYIDPEYWMTRRLKPSSDVYNLGVVILEVLTGKKACTQSENTSLVFVALPIIEAGNLGELLDKRPIPEPTAGQLQALEHVARTAVCCLQMVGTDRPNISDIVADLEMALELFCNSAILPIERNFTKEEIVAATNNFDPDRELGSDSFGMVYRGRLDDGREVAVKRIRNLQWSSLDLKKQFCTEIDILCRIRHRHIIRLLGWCVSKETNPLTSRINEPERLIVYEYTENGSLFKQLHSSLLSPVTVSWKMRIDVLLGVSRAIEHLHCHANPPIIHHDIKSSNILLDASWVPRLSHFGSSVSRHVGSEDSGLQSIVSGTCGYLDPEYHNTCCLEPSSDVYNLGVLILEVLTGKKPYIIELQKMLASFAVPIIEAGNLEELLDRRPIPELTAGQLQALEHVAQTAVRCLQMIGRDRPGISDIAANLEMALELISIDERGSS